MKNQLENWEIGLGDRMKSEEFSYDPEAFADFEALFVAEAVGGHAAPPDPASPSAGGTLLGGATISLKTLLLGGLALVFGGLLVVYLSRPTPTVKVDPPVTGLDMGSTKPAPKVSTELNAGVAPEGAVTEPIATPLTGEDRRLARIKALTTGNLPVTAPATPVTESLATKVYPSTAFTPSLLPQTRAVVSISSLPLRPLAVPKIAYSIPSVSPSGNTPPSTDRKRNRKTLFPDVIDH